MSLYQSMSSKAKESSDMDFFRLLGILLDNKWLIVVITCVFVMAGVIYAILATPIYQADALVQIEDASPVINPLAEVNTLLGQEPPSQAETEIIQSRMVLGRTVEILNLDLVVEPINIPIIGGFLKRRGVERPSVLTAEKEKGVSWYQKKVYGYTWADEYISVKAMSVSNAYLDENFLIKVKSKNRYYLKYEGEIVGEGVVGKSESFLDGDVTLEVDKIVAPPGALFRIKRVNRLKAIAILRDSMTVAEKGKETGILNWGLVNPSPTLAKKALETISDIYVAQNIQRQSEEARKSLTFLKDQVPQVRKELKEAEEDLNDYLTKHDSVDYTLETQSVLESVMDIESRLVELNFAEAEISRRFTSSHPTYKALLEKKEQLKKEKINLEKKINRLPETQQQVLRLRRDVSVTQEIYVQLRNKVQEMQIAEASTVGNVRILDKAAVFKEPILPAKKIIVAIMTLLGVLVAIGIALLRNALNQGVEIPSDIGDLGIPVYAAIPRSEDQDKYDRKIQKHNKERSFKQTTAGLLAQRDATDITIEELRALRTSLQFTMMEGVNNRILICGPSPGIGKTFITVNLAAVYAQQNKKVLIIDGDMRKGHVHGIFREHCKVGLSEVLAGKVALHEAIRPVEHIPNLGYIARGTAPPNPSELLTTPRFAELLEQASQEYDVVLIDSPPILAVTDAAVIGAHTGTSLMIARFRVTTTKQIETAIERLEASGTSINGVVLNAMERKAAIAYDYDNYHYSYSAEN